MDDVLTLMNIVIGQITPHHVNADVDINLRVQAMKEFKDGWPGPLYDPLGK